VTPIEKIRAEVAEAENCCDCYGERRLAADKWKLAKWINRQAEDQHSHTCEEFEDGFVAGADGCLGCSAKRVLEEVAR
jgi:hypothetical protein